MKSLSLTLAAELRLLVLIGGGEFSFGETREIDEFLVAKMPEGKRTIAFLPTASGSSEYAIHLGGYFKAIDPSLEVVNVPIYRGRDVRRQKNLSMILGAGMVYLGGGVTNQLVETLRGTAAEASLREAAAGGAVIAAIGAAAAAFGTHVRDMRGAGSAIPALGWIRNTVIDTGFDPADDTMLRRLMSVPGTELGLGIPARTAIVVASDGSTEVLGSGSIAVFRKQK
jgi:cyanophycinase-like exopeptidase